MLLRSEREEVVRLCQKMQADGLTVGTSGNVSVRGKDGLLAMSPSGLAYESMTAEDVVVVDLDGNMVDGSRPPSSETDMHRLVLGARPDVGCVIHTHSPYATMLACLERDLPPIYPNLTCASSGTGASGVKCMPFMQSHTAAFGVGVVRTLGEDFAVLLGHHGVLVCGVDAGYAYTVATTVEYCARMYVGASAVAEPRALDADELSDCAGRFRRMRAAAEV